MEKKKKQKKIQAEPPVFDTAESHNHSYHQGPHEMSTERRPVEIMNQRNDRAELSDSWIRPPREIMNERSDRAELSCS